MWCTYIIYLHWKLNSTHWSPFIRKKHIMIVRYIRLYLCRLLGGYGLKRSLVGCLVIQGDWMGKGVLLIRPQKTRDPMPQQVWHDKHPFLLRDHKVCNLQYFTSDGDVSTWMQYFERDVHHWSTIKCHIVLLGYTFLKRSVIGLYWKQFMYKN